MYDDFSKYDIYTNVKSVYCYKESNTLRNKYGIRDYIRLKNVEKDVTGARQDFLLENPINGRFTKNHLCRIHRFLFEDIYYFAGHFRVETIKKGDTTFENEKVISKKLSKLLDSLKKEKYLTILSYEDFINRISYYLAELNYIHPFREGNGRATREFIRLISVKNGYTINWSAVDIDILMNAMIESVYDTTPLSNVLLICISKQKEP